METLIELYDDRPLENVLGVETFHPRRVVYVCPDSAFQDRRLGEKLKTYFKHREMDVHVILERTSVYDAESVLQVLRKIVTQYPDCAIDITGGTDAVLFAAGRLSAEVPVPFFTYSRRKNCFFDIRHASFADRVGCDVCYSVEDLFVMAGGSMRPGRVDRSALQGGLAFVEPFFKIYLQNRRQWPKIVTYIQRISAAHAEEQNLTAEGAFVVKGERGARVSAPTEVLRELEQIGMIRELSIQEGESVQFTFSKEAYRGFLRDVGSVLELYVYKTCLDLEAFQDVCLSAVVDWEGTAGRNAVSNELDVVCTKGVEPVFISCKTCDVKTEALNELAILRDRFGGQMARAVIVTAERGTAAMRNRASELNIEVIDLNDLTQDRIAQRLRRILQKQNRKD